MDAVRLSVAVIAACCLVLAGTAAAATSEQPTASPNYMIVEPQFGAGSSQGDCSENYCANTSVGDTAAGRTGSENYRALAGGAGTDEPLLEVIASGGMANLGALSPTATSMLTMTVSVRNYLTGGYVMQIAGDVPGYGQYKLAALDEPAASRVGVEQFGINLVANQTPAVGADPVQVPSGEFSFGKVAPEYGTPDKFMYKDGDIVAYSEIDSGRTDYTISMIINISNITPQGWYASFFSAVVAPMY